MRKTKIICTLGPTSEKPQMLKELLENGANVFRLNFSHGDYEEHGRRIKLVREISKDMGLPVAILLDTKGPEIRLGKLKGDQVELKEGQGFILTTEEIKGDENGVSVHFKDIVRDVKKGTTILLDDGLVELVVTDISETKVYCEVINGGILGSGKGVNIPGIPISLPAVTPKDIQDIKFGIVVSV